MAQGLKYPKEVASRIEVKEGSETRVITDTLSDLAIVPYGGFWGVDELMKTGMGCGAQLAIVRTLESYPTNREAKAFIEGFMAGRLDRKKFNK